MSLSNGSLGLTLFRTPSSIAISIALNARYGLPAGSGRRYSIRRAVGLGVWTGMRIAAERFRCEYARFTGASKPGTSRLYELVVGLVNAHNAAACLSRPPTAYRAASDRPAYPAPANRFRPSFHSDAWTCRPDPLSPKSGLGMNVAVLPCRRATFLTTHVNFMP